MLFSCDFLIFLLIILDFSRNDQFIPLSVVHLRSSVFLFLFQKHRSSSKFSLQSWVGGFSGKHSSTFLHNQSSLNGKNGDSNGKRRSKFPKAGGNFSMHSQGSAGNPIPVSNEDEKGVSYLDKCVVNQDSGCSKSSQSGTTLPTNSNSRTGNVQEVPQKDKPDVVHKIKWGDLEEDTFVQNQESSVGPEIKFGAISDNNLPVCRNSEISNDLVSCVSSCTDPLGNHLEIISGNADVVANENSLSLGNESIEGKSTKVNEISLKDMEVLVEDGGTGPKNDVSYCKEVHHECVKLINDCTLSSSCPTGGDAEMTVKLQVPIIMSQDSHSEISELPVRNGDSTTLMVVQDSMSYPPENSGPEVSGESTITDSVEVSGVAQDSKIHHDASKLEIMSSSGEGDAGESKERFRQRLWCFLFENLNRAVDELYLLCELECDLEQMKEAILVLEEAASDFKELNSRVKEFEKVKKSSSQLTDSTPMTMKTDHRRPHALSWEVRRMTTSPHRAEILSSSLEAFKKIQQERASMRQVNDPKIPGPEFPIQYCKDSILKPRKQGGVSDLIQGNLNAEKRNVEPVKSSKLNSVQNGRVSSQNCSTSDPNSCRLPVKDGSAFSGKGKREHLGFTSESDKLLPKKDTMLTESNIEKNPKPMDHLKRQIPIAEKDKDKEKEKRNAPSWKSMDAWKEKRNWEDILASPFRVSSRVSHSPGMSRRSVERARILHDKLMTPEKRKKTALDLKKEAEEKHARAMRIRSELENERVQKLQRTSEKLNRVNEWQAVRSMKLREGMYARHQRSESRHEAFLAQVVRRAGDESSKVNEVRFITSLNEENKKLMLRQKLHDSEVRRAEKLQRLAETQRKKEEALFRREEERKASSAAREAKAIEQLRRREVRAKAQQEEAELLAQKLAEKLSESEQRRKFYLEQIRERASMDFRDQSSPLLRRSLNKDSQGRSTPTNNNEDYQATSISGLGSATIPTGNVGLQQSMRRRIKRIRQKLMALKYEFLEPPVGNENAGIGYRTAMELQEQKLAGGFRNSRNSGKQGRKELQFLEGKDPELNASRQAGLVDFIASALPASHTSKPEACQVTIYLLRLLRVVLSVPATRSYFLAQNLLPPIIPMLSAALENYIKIAASLNIPGSTSLSSSKASVENFESISEVLDGFLWTVTTIIGHISSDERQLQMQDGLLELVIAYQVIHRLRDLFALYDRPQVEGAPFPSSILLRNEIQEAKLTESADFGHSYVNNSSGDPRPPLSTLNDASDSSQTNLSEDISKSCIPQKGEQNSKNICAEQKTENISSLKQPMAFLLSAISDTGLVSLPSLLTAVLLQANNRLSSEQDLILDMGECHMSRILPTVQMYTNFYGLAWVPPRSIEDMLVIAFKGLGNSLRGKTLWQIACLTLLWMGSYVLPSNFEEVATGVLKVLNNLALIDITFMQRMLARPDLKMEFFHLMSFLLSHCTSKWKVAYDQVIHDEFPSFTLSHHMPYTTQKHT
ncbi:S phase cyclin A-associated protein in the endoplasmic reticulum [Vitis vinifera]|uniref:S phase cyclin A-associated protein in the endoplasmic reticulum n=1 Tax=Vitis vinifera TaxID=29760 RepID=A0A438D8F8_VITVI|nr:S phase cyclin A-associated protein in the endoplasmic reticulum [Vitis vinifera]